ncbi:MAG: AAA family ATPase, partial [Mycetocola sp.]
MRILSVQMRGFGPFREQQHLDLEGFTDGLFLITGRTGAGKSSLLDAVCFALYGSVPRYDGVESRLRSDFSAPDEPSEVSVRFETAGGEYLITRSPAWERPKKNGTGTTPQKAEARLARRDGDGWEVVMSGPRAVGPEIERLLGLTRAQFLQVVLLAQNRFQEFLRAGNDDRQAVLRSLFGSERFDRFEQALAERRRDEEDRGGADRADLARQIELLAELCASSGAEMPDAPDGDARDSERIRDWSVECERLLAESCVLARAASTAADTALEASITERDAARRESEEYERFSLLAARRDRWT